MSKRNTEAAPTVCRPERVHALVVGIEDYQDANWNVRGPYADARAFSAWLLKEGVPAGNITFLSKRLPDTAQSDQLPPSAWDVQQQELTVNSLEYFVRGQLPRLDSDLLWVFWSGHGVIDRDLNPQLLLPKDGLLGQPTVDVRDLLTVLQSTHSGDRLGQGLARVAVVFNACQEQLPPDVDLPTRHVGVRTDGAKVIPRPVFVCYSSSPGQRAYVDNPAPAAPGEPVSRLPRALMAVLGQEPGIMPVPGRVMRHVDAVFDEHHRAGQVPQTPSWELKNWPGTADHATGVWALNPTDEERALAQLVAAELKTAPTLQQFAEALADMGVATSPGSNAEHVSAEQIVVAAGRTPHGIPTLIELLRTATCMASDRHSQVCAAAREIRRDEYLTLHEHTSLLATLAEVGEAVAAAARYDLTWREHLPAGALPISVIVRNLEAAGAFPTSIPLLLQFVALVAAEGQRYAADTGVPTAVAASLDGWWSDVSGRLGYTPDLIEAQRRQAADKAVRLLQSPETWLLVQVRTENPEAGPGETLYSCSAWYVDVQGRTQRLPSAQQWLPWRESAWELGNTLQQYIDQIDCIEFLLSQAQLELPVERIGVDHANVYNKPLGTVRPVVVRWADRNDASPSYRTSWEERWHGSFKNCTSGEQWLVHPAEDSKALAAQLDERQSLGCVQLVGAKHPSTDAFSTCLNAAVPIIAWNRSTAPAQAQNPFESIRGVAPPQMPGRVFQLRQAASMNADHVVLLWDNPARRPPTRRTLHAPRRRTS